MITYKIIPTWAHKIIQDVEKYGALDGSLRESKRHCTYSSYVVLLSNIIGVEPSNYEEVVEKKVWKDVMLKEYQLIMKNDVWDIVPRPKRKSTVNSK